MRFPLPPVLQKLKKLNNFYIQSGLSKTKPVVGSNQIQQDHTLFRVSYNYEIVTVKMGQVFTLAIKIMVRMSISHIGVAVDSTAGSSS